MPITPEIITTLLADAEHDDIQKIGVGAVIVKDGQFLIVRRAANEDFLPGLEEIPSGGVDPGEDILAALRREVWEETGLNITDIYSYENHFDYLSGSGKKTRELNFLVTTDGFDIKLNPAEHDSYAWMLPSSDAFKNAKLSSETRLCLEQIAVRLILL